MQICLSCVNKMENEEEDEEEYMDNDSIERTFIDDEEDTWVPIANIDPWAENIDPWADTWTSSDLTPEYVISLFFLF